MIITGKRTHIDVVLGVEPRAVSFIVSNTFERHVKTLNCNAEKDFAGAEDLTQPNLDYLQPLSLHPNFAFSFLQLLSNAFFRKKKAKRKTLQ